MKQDKKKCMFIHRIISSMENSCEYPNEYLRLIAIGSLKMLWDNCGLEFYNNTEISKDDYKKYFKEDAEKNNLDEYVYTLLFNNDGEQEEVKK